MPPNILVVDDSATIRTLLCVALEDDGYDVSVAASGEDALDQIAESLPDVMLLDVRRDYTHAVICRHDKIYFARRLSVGLAALANDKMLDRLNIEIGTCRRDFEMLYSDVILKRLVFLSGASVPNDVYMAIAQELEMTAQVGDCLNAVAQTSLVKQQKEFNHMSGSWASAFGVCLM